jgi:uncharacterized protein (DUF983 family)
LTERRGAAPFLAGARGRCPNCGAGPLYAGFLTVTPRCAACGYDLAGSDSGDVFGALFTMIAFRPPVWVPLVVWIPAAGVLCMALLRPMKGLMIAAHVRNRTLRGASDNTP